MNKDVKFTLSAAAAHLVTAYKKAIEAYRADAITVQVGISDASPETFEALWAQYQSGLITVNTAHSETAIYGKAGNATFRVFHDIGHIVYLKQFTMADEVELAQRQWYDILPHIPAQWVDVCRVVYLADTCEQSKFADANNGAFPVDQTAFVGAYLAQSFALATGK